MDLVVELFRHHTDRSFDYELVAHIAARLNDLEQLEMWRAEFGFIPPEAFYGAAQSDQVDTFDFVFSQVELDGIIAYDVFECIGETGNRALLEHLRSKYPEMVTPGRLETVVKCSARRRRFDFALQVFESMTPRSGQVIIACAGHIAREAAQHGNTALFTEFINMFQYDDVCRDDIAAFAAIEGRMELIRLQEEGRNAAVSFGGALERAVDNNDLEVAQFLLANDDFVTNRFESYSLVDGLRWAIELKRTEMLPLLLARVHRISLLHDAAKSESLDEAKLLLGGFGISDKIRAENENWAVEFDAYSAEVPDWKMKIWLIIIGLDSDARLLKSDIDDAERARYQSVLPAAIDLARELNLDDGVTIDEMTRFTNGVYQ